MIIALPEEYQYLKPGEVLKKFTDYFKEKYGVECISALHHNNSQTNYHIHLIFSERKELPEPEVMKMVNTAEPRKRFWIQMEIFVEDALSYQKGKHIEVIILNRKTLILSLEDFCRN